MWQVNKLNKINKRSCSRIAAFCSWSGPDVKGRRNRVLSVFRQPTVINVVRQLHTGTKLKRLWVLERCSGKSTLASHQCGPGSNPGVDAICGLSLLLVLSLAPRGFSPGTPEFPSPQKPTLPNSNSIWNTWKHLIGFLRTPKSSVGEQIKTNYNYKLQGNISTHWTALKPSINSRWIFRCSWQNFTPCAKALFNSYKTNVILINLWLEKLPANTNLTQ